MCHFSLVFIPAQFSLPTRWDMRQRSNTAGVFSDQVHWISTHTAQPALVNVTHVGSGYQAQESDGRTRIIKPKKPPQTISQLSSRRRVFSLNVLHPPNSWIVISEWVCVQGDRNYPQNILNGTFLAVPGLGYFSSSVEQIKPGRKRSTGLKLYEITNRQLLQNKQKHQI